jgi:nicotinic acid mononucleotide adenylyltransferase
MAVSQADLDRVITDIHAAPHQIVLEFAGAGVQALAWLHGVGGSSRTVLEATDHYASTSLIEAIGFNPDQFTSTEVAQALAVKAFFRASHLAGPSTEVVGLGCTATIATDYAKRGEHRCRLAVCDAQGVTSYAVTLSKGRRTRRAEESLVSLLIIKAVGERCGLSNLPDLPLYDEEQLKKSFEPVDLAARLVAGEVEWMVVWPDGRQATGTTWPNLALLSGAFNPLHRGHRQLARVAAKKLQQEIYFELPLVNADKAPLIELAEVRRRAAQFAGFAPVVLTRAPLFSQKAGLFPQSVFILGVDTVARLVEPRFYHSDPAEMRTSFESVRQAGCRFLVAGRLVADHFLTLADVDLPDEYRPMFEQIPENDFRIDISSTTIRRSNENKI